MTTRRPVLRKTIERARRQLRTARALARDPRTPPAERRAAERTIRSLIREFPALAKEPDRVAEAVGELRRRRPEEVLEAARVVAVIDGSTGAETLARCEAVATQRGIDPLAMHEAIYQGAQLVRATQSGDLEAAARRQRQQRAGDGFSMGAGFDDLGAIFSALNTPRAPAPPPPTVPARAAYLPRCQWPPDGFAAQCRRSVDAPGERFCAIHGGRAAPTPSHALPAPEGASAPPPVPEPLFLADPCDYRTHGGQRFHRPHGAHPGWPSPMREPPWDPSWWDANVLRWRAPDWNMPRHVAPWVPMLVWELVAALERIYGRARLTREPLLLTHDPAVKAPIIFAPPPALPSPPPA